MALQMAGLRLQRAELRLQMAWLRLQRAGLSLLSLYPISEGNPVRAERVARRAEWAAAEL